MRENTAFHSLQTAREVKSNVSSLFFSVVLL